MWPGRLALVFVLVTLAALMAVPLLVQQRVAQHRVGVEGAEPARTLVSRLQFALVRELASVNELILSGAPEYAEAYRAARAAERQVYVELEPLAERLGADVTARFRTVRSLATEWHERARDDEFAARDTAGSGLRGRELELFEQTLRAAAALDSAIVARVAHGRAGIGRVERTGRQLTLLLGLLAVLAALVVAALDARTGRYAADAERRRRQAERALAESARAEQARTRLLRGVTHDVKNPLGAAKGYAELLALGVKAPLAPEQAPLVEGIQRSVDGALAIITDLLDVARADSGGLAIHRVPTDLAQIAGTVVADHRAAAEAAGHALHLRGDETVPAIHTDPARVQQVLQNLLSNAIKYTPAPGQITVRLGTEAEAENGRGGRQWAVVQVSDTGPGIPAALREQIFDEFARVDDRAPATGHGLGLAIARRVARLLGGDLVLSEAPEPGATFLLRLPLRRSGDEAAMTENRDRTEHA